VPALTAGAKRTRRLRAWVRTRAGRQNSSRRARLAWLCVLEDAIASGVAAGEFRDVEPKESAAALAALIDGLALQVISGRRLTAAAMRQLLRRHLDRDLFADSRVSMSTPVSSRYSTGTQ